MTEYILIVVLIVLAAIGVYSFYDQAMRGQLASMTNEISGGSAASGQAAAKGAAASATGEQAKKFETTPFITYVSTSETLGVRVSIPFSYHVLWTGPT